jgi:hypothetical protein
MLARRQLNSPYCQRFKHPDLVCFAASAAIRPTFAGPLLLAGLPGHPFAAGWQGRLTPRPGAKRNSLKSIDRSAAPRASPVEGFTSSATNP